MGSEVCADESMNEQVICGNWGLICDEEAKNVAGPATPEENGEHNHLSSPPPSSPDVETPKETLFDSFAPASDKLLLLAPRHRKYWDESRSHVVRRLNFTSLIKEFDNAAAEEDASDDEQRLYEIVYTTIMEAISAEQAGEGTPRSTPLLTGIAETCPAAPVKSAARHRCIDKDKEICRKLEF